MRVDRIRDNNLTRRDALKIIAAGLGIAGAGLIRLSFLGGQTDAKVGDGDSEQALRWIVGVLQKTSPENLNQSTADALLDLGLAASAQIDKARQRGNINIASNPGQENELFVDTRNPQILSFGVKSPLDGSWINIYGAKGNNGKWLQGVKITPEDSGFRIEQIFEFGKRDDGF